MRTFFEPIEDLAGYQSIVKLLDTQGKTAMISGCIDSEKAHLVNALGQKTKCRVIITYDETKAREIFDDCRFYNRNTVYYPAKDFIFYSADVHGNVIIKERLEVIKQIIINRDDTNDNDTLTVITTIDGCAEMLLTMETIAKNVLTFEEGKVYDIENLKKVLVRLGYERMGQVSGNGQFAIRGGIIDIFPLTEAAPIRIEMWDDEIDSIRAFDVESQRSVERLEKVEIYPASEVIFTENEIQDGIISIKTELKIQMAVLKKEGNIEAAKRLEREINEFDESIGCERYLHSFAKTTVSFLDYFDRENTIFVVDEPNRLKDKMDLVELEFSESMINRLTNGYILPSQSNMLYSTREIYAKLNARKSLVFTTLEYKPELIEIEESFRIDCKSVSLYNNRFEFLVEDLKKYKKSKYKVIVVSNSRTRAQRLAADLREYELSSYIS